MRTLPPNGPAPPPGSRPLAIEGIFQSLGQGLGDAYLGAFALRLGAGGVALGLVSSLPTAATALAQILGRWIRAGTGGARRLTARAWSAQALGYASLGLCLLLPPPGAVLALCAGAFVAWGLGGLAVPAWTFLVSRVVPRKRHGWFFALRGALQQVGVLAAVVGGGALLSWMAAAGSEGPGFALLFVLAGLARLAGTGLLARVPDHPLRRPAGPRARALSFFETSRKVRRLALYLWCLQLGTHVLSPFIIPYLLRDLHFSYARIGLLVAVPALVKTCTLHLWGILADRLGPGPILRASGWLVALVPALWLVSPSAGWILAAQIYSGLVWGAFELARASSLLQATRGKEGEVALFSLVDGAMTITGSLLGGATVAFFERSGGSGYPAAMVLSLLLRLLPALVLLWRVRGIGKPAGSHLRIPLRVWAVRPTRGVSLRLWGEIPAEESGEGPSLPGPGR